MPQGCAERVSFGRRLFSRAYEDFGVRAPAVDGFSFGVTVTGAALYALLMFAFWCTLNIGALPFGVFVEPLWRPGAKFRRLALPNGIPLIAICLPVLLAYAGYNTYVLRGSLLFPLGPFALVGIAGLTMLGLIMAFNRIRSTIFRTTR